MVRIAIGLKLIRKQAIKCRVFILVFFYLSAIFCFESFASRMYAAMPSLYNFVSLSTQIRKNEEEKKAKKRKKLHGWEFWHLHCYIIEKCIGLSTQNITTMACLLLLCIAIEQRPHQPNIKIKRVKKLLMLSAWRLNSRTLNAWIL